MTSTQDVINAVRDRHGINLEMSNTGGGCYVLEGRLEDGTWLRAADHEDFCYPELRDRHRAEQEHGPLGWDVSIHSNVHDEGGPWTDGDGRTHDIPPSDYWASGDIEPIHWHADPDATVDDLPRVIGDAFASMPADAKQRQQDGLREQLTRSGLKPGDKEWRQHFPNEAGPSGGGKRMPDYEDLVNPRDDLGDEDFGHIFGRLDMADLIRLAGDGMSWEDTMRHIDEALAAGEPEDHSDYSTDYSVNHYDEVDTEEDRLAEQARRNQEEDDLTDRLWDEWMGQLSGKHHRWLEEVNPKAMDHDFAAYHDHHVNGTPYTMTPVPQDELHRQQQTLRSPHTAALDYADIVRLAGDGMSWRTAAEDVHLPPDEPHDDWRPKYKNVGPHNRWNIFKWHPPYGESHVKYHIFQMGGGRNPVRWGANHHGLYLGMETLHPPDGSGSSFTIPKYQLSDDVEVLGYSRTPEQAKKAAEAHYEEHYRNAPRPDPMHGYDDLGRFMDENPPTDPRRMGDGEDYGHIFGMLRRAGWDTADIVRLAGDGMSFEDTMHHIDRVLAEGEGHDLHHVPGADYFPPEHSGYYDHSDIFDHCRACGGDGLDPAGGQCEGCAGTGENQGDPYGDCDGCGQEFGVEDLEGEPDVGVYCPDCARTRRGGQRHALADPAMAPQTPVGGGFQPAHRVGLDWRDRTVPGTVIGLDGDQLSIRWDDGQYTSENPTEVHLL